VDVAAITAIVDRTKPSAEGCSQVRLEAVVSLGSLPYPAGAADKAAVERALQNAVADRDRAVGIWARVALMAHNVAAEEQLKRQLELIVKDIAKPGKAAEKIQKEKELAEEGRAVEAQLKEIVKFLNPTKEPATVRLHAVRALGTAGKRAKSSMPELIASFRDPDPTVAVMGITAVVGMTEAGDASKVISALQGIAGDKNLNADVQGTAKDAIEHIQKEQTKKPAEK
jgi:hypothetical protein